jgi:hypothetical protein
MDRRNAILITTSNRILILVSLLLGAACTRNNEVEHDATHKIMSTCEACTENYKDSLIKEIVQVKNNAAYLEYVGCYFNDGQNIEELIELSIFMAEYGSGDASLNMTTYYLSLDTTYFFSTKESSELIANFDSLGLAKQKKVIQYLTQTVEQNIMFSEMYEALLHR